MKEEKIKDLLNNAVKKSGIDSTSEVQLVSTPDSICLYEKIKGLLFVGDTLYEGPIYLQLPESNFTQYKRSIKKLLLLPHVKKIFSAHNEYMFPLKKLADISYVLSTFNENEIGKNILTIDSKISLLI